MRRIAVLALALVALASACSSTSSTTGNAGPSSGGSTPATTAKASDTKGGDTKGTTPGADKATYANATWEIHDAAKPCQCADGSPYQFLTRTADPKKVVLYFEGGGACFSADTCRFDSGTYKTKANAAAIAKGDGEAGQGIFDFANPDNPLTDWSFVFVPYCTGDVHIGSAEHAYSDTLTVHHNGADNAKAAIAQLVTQFPDATEVLVTGSSAGGVPSPLAGGLVADGLPDAKVTVLADGSGAYPDNPPINAGIGGLWGTMNAVPDWPVTKGMTPEQFSIPGLFVLAGKTHPEIRFARYDNAYDQVQKMFSALARVGGGDQKQVILANEAQIEAAGVPIESYLAAGTDHTILARKEFYALTTDGVSFRDWFTRYVDGEQVGDVHCTECGGPDATSDTGAPTTTAG